MLRPQGPGLRFSACRDLETEDAFKEDHVLVNILAE